jgi:hypothetical protein
LVKKQKPAWSPSTLEDVDLEKIRQKYFTNVQEFAVEKTKQEYFTHPNCSRFILPSQQEIEQVFGQLNQDRQKTAEYFVSKYNDKFGVQLKVKEGIRAM